MAQYYTDNANFTEALRVIRKALRIAKSAEIILTQTFNDAQNKAKNHMVKMMVAGLS